MKKLFSYLLTCLIVSIVLAPIMNKNVLQSREEFFITVLFGLIYTFSGLYGSIWLFRYLDKKYDWLKNIWKRLVFGIVAVEVWSILIYMLVTPLLLFFFRGDSPEGIFDELKKNGVIALVMGLPGMLIITSIEFFRYWKQSYLKEEKLKAEMMAYKYEALHNQLNPHFLFNSFNVLSSLVYENPALAADFIDQLSELYKRVLNNRDKELIPLAEELEFIQSYIFLLKTRFEDKLMILVNVEAEDGECIAPMVLQLLIENAVKHNSISKAEPLVIHIERSEDMIETRNKIRLKRVGDESRGTGLLNIQQRYGFFTDRPVEIAEKDGEFVVNVPILKKRSK